MNDSAPTVDRVPLEEPPPGGIDGLDPGPEFRARRRAALERTFDQLAETIRAR